MTAVFKYLKGHHTEGGLGVLCMPTRRQISTQPKKELSNSQDFQRPLPCEIVRALSMKADARQHLRMWLKSLNLSTGRTTWISKLPSDSKF